MIPDGFGLATDKFDHRGQSNPRCSRTIGPDRWVRRFGVAQRLSSGCSESSTVVVLLLTQATFHALILASSPMGLSAK
jgi:hypothetical protein